MFEQVWPIQKQHITMQCRPAFRHRNLELHCTLQPQETTCSRLSGASALSVNTGEMIPSRTFHLYCVVSKPLGFTNHYELDNKLCTSDTYMLQMLERAASGEICLMICLSSAYTWYTIVHLKLSRSCDCHTGVWESILQPLLSSHGWNRVTERQLVSPNYCSAFFLLIPYRADTVSHPEIACAKSMCSRTAG